MARVLSDITGTETTILTLHRFAVSDYGISGHDPAALRTILAYLRKQRFQLISVKEIFRRLREGEPLERAVAFTLDDGYFDQGEIGAPVFAEFDCPATTFVVTGFLDGHIWLWWDRIQYLVAHTDKRELHVRIGAEQLTYSLDGPQTRRRVARDIATRCENLPHAERVACIEDLIRDTHVELTTAPPPAFAPLSWDDVRRLEKRGMQFGPHSVTHPVLSSTSAEHSAFEIAGSWQRLSAEATEPVPVFCYPAGRRQDFGPREIAAVERAGLLGAVRSFPGGFHLTKHSRSPGIYSVPRFPSQDNLLDVLQCISGVEVLKGRIRRNAA